MLPGVVRGFRLLGEAALLHTADTEADAQHGDERVSREAFRALRGIPAVMDHDRAQDVETASAAPDVETIEEGFALARGRRGPRKTARVSHGKFVKRLLARDAAFVKFHNRQVLRHGDLARPTPGGEKMKQCIATSGA